MEGSVTLKKGPRAGSGNPKAERAERARLESVIAMEQKNTIPDDLFARVSSQVEASSEEIIGFLKNLVSFRTASQDPKDEYFVAGIRACHAFLASNLEAMGCQLDRWDAPPMSFQEHPIMVGKLPGSGGGRSMALNGHVDVVPAGELSSWHHDPWGGEVSDGKLWGRGACDMKGGVAAMIQALKIVRDCGFRLKGDAYVHVVSDEEVVGFGSRQCAERAPRPDFVISTEPTRLDLFPGRGRPRALPHRNRRPGRTCRPPVLLDLSARNGQRPRRQRGGEGRSHRSGLATVGAELGAVPKPSPPSRRLQHPPAGCIHRGVGRREEWPAQ